MAAGALSKQGVLRMQLHAKLKVIAVLTRFRNAHGARRHASYRTLFGVQNLGCSKTWEHIHAERFCLRT